MPFNDELPNYSVHPIEKMAILKKASELSGIAVYILDGIPNLLMKYYKDPENYCYVCIDGQDLSEFWKIYERIKNNENMA